MVGVGRLWARGQAGGSGGAGGWVTPAVQGRRGQGEMAATAAVRRPAFTTLARREARQLAGPADVPLSSKTGCRRPAQGRLQAPLARTLPTHSPCKHNACAQGTPAARLAAIRTSGAGSASRCACRRPVMSAAMQQTFVRNRERAGRRPNCDRKHSRAPPTEGCSERPLRAFTVTYNGQCAMQRLHLCKCM